MKINKLEVWIANRLVGRLALNDHGLALFEYDPEFVRDGFSISPFELPLKSGVFMAKPEPFGGNFGVFDDALPDGWGLLTLDRYLRKKGINLNDLTLLDRLSLVGSAGRGALEFYPDRSVFSELEFVDFHQLAKEAQKILADDTYEGKGIEDFILRGGSPGGARPKVFTKFDGKEWLVKFPAKNDPVKIGEIEYRYSLLARECGIEMPETRLIEDKYFAAERFDRTPEGKLHVISIGGLIGADYRIPSMDYLHIFKAGRVLTQNVEDLWKIYRLMVFNYLIGNKDDHAKNFSFIMRGGEWRFAPAYDLLPSDGFNGFHTTTINDKIEPTEADLIEVAVKAGLDSTQAHECLSTIRSRLHSTTRNP